MDFRTEGQINNFVTLWGQVVLHVVRDSSVIATRPSNNATGTIEEVT